MIDNLSKKIAASLASQLSIDRDTQEVYQYGLNLLMGALIEVILVLLISFVLQTLYITAVVMLVFAVFRGVGGGAHMSTRGRCLLVGTVQIVALGALAALPIDSRFLYILLACTALFNIWVIIKWVPGGTDKKPLKDPLTRRKSKLIAFIITIVWLTAALSLIITGNTHYVLAIILGALSALFLVTPFGYRFNSVFDVKPGF